MAAQYNTESRNSSCTQHQKRKLNNRSTSISPTRIDIHRSETTLLPNDELECRQIYEKLQRLQPNGVCVNLNTLRRALYPPTSFSKDRNDQILLLKTSHQRTNVLPKIRFYDIQKPTKVNKKDHISIDRIINQVKKHAAINYSYYTRTK